MLTYKEYYNGNSNEPNKMVIFLHGYGSNGDDLISLASMFNLKSDIIYLSPDAPHQFDYAHNGYKWFDLESYSEDYLYDGLSSVQPIILDFINKKLEQYNLKQSDLFLIGFSQGAMLAIHLALSMNDSLAGVIAYSGAFIKPSSFINKTIPNTPILLIHGNMDEVVDYHEMDKAYKELKKLGVEVKHYTQHNTGHQITNAGIIKAKEFMEEIIL